MTKEGSCWPSTPGGRSIRFSHTRISSRVAGMGLSRRIGHRSILRGKKVWAHCGKKATYPSNIEIK